MDKKMEEERNKNLKKKLELNLSLSRDKILQDLLRGKEFPFQELDYIQNEYNISLQKGMVQVGIIEIGNFDADSRELIKSGRFDSKYFVGISGVKLQHGGNGYRAYQRYPSAGGSGASGL